MLLTTLELDGIADGRITLAFRRWTRPTVKTGGRLRTAIGELVITLVEPCVVDAITAADAKAAGYESRAALLEALNARQGTVYRIAFGGVRPDARVALRADAALSAEGVSTITAALTRLDARSPGGAWSQATLKMIGAHPATLAAILAARMGLDRDRFKQRVRKLKELGLTESLEVGYRLSPRGEAYLSLSSASVLRRRDPAPE